MFETLYMMEIKQVLDGVSAVAGRKSCSRENLEATKEAAVSILISYFGLTLDNAQDKVVIATGEDI